MSDEDSVFARIAVALETLAGLRSASLRVDGGSLASSLGFVWHPPARLRAMADISGEPLGVLAAIDRQRAAVRSNLARFAEGAPAHDMLLWGARGMGKSSLVKAAFLEAARGEARLGLVAIAREDLASLPDLLLALGGAGAQGAAGGGASEQGANAKSARRFVVWCDDMAFGAQEAGWKALKPALEGALGGRPANALFVATSNRRDLLTRDDTADADSADARNERTALAERFGLRLGFHAPDREAYLAMVAGHLRRYGLTADTDTEVRAMRFALARSGMSGRAARQFARAAAAKVGARLGH